MRSSGVHPFRKSLAELQIGDQLVTAAREVTLEDVEHFAHFTGDTFYAHMDDRGRQGQPVLRRPRRAWLSDRRPSRRACSSIRHPGPVLANYGVDNLRFLTPVYFGDTLQVRADLQGDQPARQSPIMARCAGIARSPTKTAPWSRNTTC